MYVFLKNNKLQCYWKNYIKIMKNCKNNNDFLRNFKTNYVQLI